MAINMRIKLRFFYGTNKVLLNTRDSVASCSRSQQKLKNLLMVSSLTAFKLLNNNMSSVWAFPNRTVLASCWRSEQHRRKLNTVSKSEATNQRDVTVRALRGDGLSRARKTLQLAATWFRQEPDFYSAKLSQPTVVRPPSLCSATFVSLPEDTKWLH